MSSPRNLATIFAANPITTIGTTDILYVAQAATTDAGISGASLLAQFQSKILTSTTARLLPWTTTTAGILALSPYSMPATITTNGILFASSTTAVSQTSAPPSADTSLLHYIGSSGYAWVSVPGTPGVFLQGFSTTQPTAFSLYTMPITTLVANELLFASTTTAVTQLPTANNGMLTTNASGVPSISTTGLPTTAVAAKTDQTTGTSAALAVTPSTQQFHASATKSWGNIAGNATINASYNVASASTGSTGVYSVTFTTPMTTANYSISPTVYSSTGAALVCTVTAMATTGFSLEVYNTLTQTLTVPTAILFSVNGVE